MSSRVPTPTSLACCTRRRPLATIAAAVVLALVIGGAPASAAPSRASGPAHQATLLRAFGYPPTDLTSKVTRPILFPVIGKVTWTDTFGACRAGCSRLHEGQDLMGTKLQKLVACVTGKVVALVHEAAGNYLYLEDAAGWYYGYLHINNDDPGTDDGRNPLAWAFAPGLKVGSAVKAGQFIAYLGDSGDAENVGAHLHFEVRKPTSRGVWHSQAVNPKYSLEAARHLAAAGPSREGAPTPPSPTAIAPFSTTSNLVRQQYHDILGRAPSPRELVKYDTAITSGRHSADWVIEVVFRSGENDRTAGALTRLYVAMLQRNPDLDGFRYWLGQLRTGRATLGTVADQLGGSEEFAHQYGRLGSRALVTTAYQAVLGRTADPAGLGYWTTQLDRRRITPARLLLQFSQAAESRTYHRSRIEAVLVSAQMLRTIPPVTLVNLTRLQLQSGHLTLGRLIHQVRLSDAYRARFA